MLKLMQTIYLFFVSILDYFALAFPSANSGKHQRQKVLLIHLSAIGDFVLFLDIAKEFRRIYPKDRFEIVLMGNSAWTQFAGNFSYWDEIWHLNRRKFLRNPGYRWNVLRKTLLAGFDIAIQTAYSREYYYGDSLIRASGAKEKIGSAGDLTNTTVCQKLKSDHWYTRLIPATQKPLMELKRNAEFLRNMGLGAFQSQVPKIIIKDASLTDQQKLPYYILSPGAGSDLRKWPVNHYAEIARRIYKETGWQGFICGGREDADKGRELEIICDGILTDLTAKTSLNQLVQRITHSKFVIGNESSAIHLSAALSVPSVCILGGGHFERFMPYNVDVVDNSRPMPQAVFHRMDCYYCNWNCIYHPAQGHPAPCVSHVSIDIVWNEILKILSKIQ